MRSKVHFPLKTYKYDFSVFQLSSAYIVQVQGNCHHLGLVAGLTI
jgi:hypothetical protein